MSDPVDSARLIGNRMAAARGLDAGDPELKTAAQQAEEAWINAVARNASNQRELEMNAIQARAAYQASTTNKNKNEPPGGNSGSAGSAIAGLIQRIFADNSSPNPNIAETPRQVFVPVPVVGNSGSPDPLAKNYNANATDDNGKSVFSGTGRIPPIDGNSPTTTAPTNYSGCAGSAYRAAAAILMGIAQGISRIFAGIRSALGLTYASGGISTYFGFRNNTREDVNQAVSMARMNAFPNSSNGDNFATNSSADTADRYIQPAPVNNFANNPGAAYTPKPSDPATLFPTNPAIPVRSPVVPGAPRVNNATVVPFKPGPLVMTGATGSIILKANPYNGTYAPVALSTTDPAQYRSISEVIKVDDRDGRNLYFNGSRTADVLARFEHGKAVEFDCTQLSYKNAIAIYKTFDATIPTSPSWDYEPAWYAQYPAYNDTHMQCRRQNEVIFGNDPFRGVYGSKIYMDISSYANNVNFFWNKTYGSVYNHMRHLRKNFHVPPHSFNASWYYKVTSNPSISGKIMFVPKTNPETTFYVTLTTLSSMNANNQLTTVNKYAVSRDNMVTWFVPSSSNKLVVSYSMPFSATHSEFDRYTYSLILTNIPPSDALCFGGYMLRSEAVWNRPEYQENVHKFSTGFAPRIRNNPKPLPITSGAQNIDYQDEQVSYFGWGNGLQRYETIFNGDPATWEYPTGEYDIPQAYRAVDVLYNGNQGHDRVKFYSSLSGGSIRFTVGNPALSSGFAPVLNTFNEAFRSGALGDTFSFINLRYALSAKNNNPRLTTAGFTPSALLVAAQYTNQYDVIGYDANSIPLLWREPYTHNPRQVARSSSTWWWDSEDTYKSNGIIPDVEFNSSDDVPPFVAAHPNLKFFTKTGDFNPANPIYDVTRDVYVERRYIGRYKLSSNLIGTNIGINKFGGNEPLLTTKLNYSAPGGSVDVLIFVTP